MQLSGKLLQVLPPQTGTGKNGPWKKQDIILETEGTYPKKVCVTIWGDKISEEQLKPGNMLTVQFDLESREYNGRWYTDVKAWKIESASGDQGPVDREFSDEGGGEGGDQDDLPF